MSHVTRAVEDDTLLCKGLGEILRRLSLARAGRTSRGAAHDEVERLCESDVAAVSEGSDHQPGSVAQVLVTVTELRVTN